jgi:hypothetical protein
MPNHRAMIRNELNEDGAETFVSIFGESTKKIVVEVRQPIGSEIDDDRKIPISDRWMAHHRFRPKFLLS